MTILDLPLELKKLAIKRTVEYYINLVFMEKK